MNKLNPSVFERFPELETERCKLREFAVSDLDEFYAIRTDAEVRKYIAKDLDPNKAFTKTVLDDIIKAFDAHQTINWVIENKQTGDFMGSVGYWRFDKEHSRAEIGYSIKKKYWAKGFMTEILRCILPFAINTVGYHSIMACTGVENIGSQKLLEKVGFKLEAHHREDWYYNGKYYDSLVYGMIGEDLHNI
ncbi:MAG: GNAT family N-acetyltransferase [Bacteroidia bacterium]